jgi:hypothetical protein
MRYQMVPPPAGCERLWAVHAAIPSSPVADCCERLCQRAHVPGRERAREWLVFLHALELARRREGSFVRARPPRRDDPEAALVTAFRRRVYGARELLETPDADPDRLLARADAEYVDRLRGWARLFDLLDPAD